MAKLANKKIQASTLIEVLIAMVIIMVVFAIAMKLFSNVMSSGVSYRKVQVQNQLQILSEEVKQKGYVPQATLKVDSVDYQFETKASDVAGIAQLEIKASMNKRELGSIKCLFKEGEKHEED